MQGFEIANRRLQLTEVSAANRQQLARLLVARLDLYNFGEKRERLGVVLLPEIDEPEI